MFRCSGAALRLLVAQAYQLQFYELAAPEWMNHGGSNGGYDLTARLPGSTSAAGFRQMLQNFPAERFLLAAHSMDTSS
jgi:uncharacterized protein (TIGR03435 family)